MYWTVRKLRIRPLKILTVTRLVLFPKFIEFFEIASDYTLSLKRTYKCLLLLSLFIFIYQKSCCCDPAKTSMRPNTNTAEWCLARPPVGDAVGTASTIRRKLACFDSLKCTMRQLVRSMLEGYVKHVFVQIDWNKPTLEIYFTLTLVRHRGRLPRVIDLLGLFNFILKLLF